MRHRTGTGGTVQTIITRQVQIIFTGEVQGGTVHINNHRTGRGGKIQIIITGQIQAVQCI